MLGQDTKIGGTNGEATVSFRPRDQYTMMIVVIHGGKYRVVEVIVASTNFENFETHTFPDLVGDQVLLVLQVSHIHNIYPMLSLPFHPPALHGR